ncbi:hypothetical protein [Streptomyces sp. IBSBF 3136]|uniref:hypothetical protein n=1 Tax=Streptomyces sp. IBSBF 3136 TaxID=2903524 RepID=UPI002FDB98A0
MSAITVLALLVALLTAVVGGAGVVFLGCLVYRRPALTQPIAIAVTATGVLAGLVLGIVQVVSR